MKKITLVTLAIAIGTGAILAKCIKETKTKEIKAEEIEETKTQEIETEEIGTEENNSNNNREDFVKIMNNTISQISTGQGNSDDMITTLKQSIDDINEILKTETNSERIKMYKDTIKSNLQLINRIKTINVKINKNEIKKKYIK